MCVQGSLPELYSHLQKARVLLPHNSPKHGIIARVVNYHLDCQSIVDVDEESVGLVPIEPGDIRLGNGINECRVVSIFAADMQEEFQMLMFRPQTATCMLVFLLNYLTLWPRNPQHVNVMIVSTSDCYIC